MTDVIVFSSILFVALFFVAWLVRPDLRAWIEKPKYRFQANVQSYDQKAHRAAESRVGTDGKRDRKGGR
jgi:hypothetical protein